MRVPDTVVSILSYLATASFAAGIGYFFTARHYQKQKRHEFSERRLNEFYAPLLSRIKQLRSDGKLRVDISRARNEAWKGTCARAPVPFQEHEEAFAPYRESIDYENRHFRDMMKLYDEMLSIFNSKRQLAFRSTLDFYDLFFRYVQLWKRWLDDAIPGDAVEKVDISEAELHPFYREIEARHDALVATLSGDRRRDKQ